MQFLRRLWGSLRPSPPARAEGPAPLPPPTASPSPPSPSLSSSQPPALPPAVRQRLAEVFTPTRPLPGSSLHLPDGDAMLVGRDGERERILRALVEDRAHIVIYGDRGRGKTSLANCVVAAARDAGFDVARHVCAATSTYDSILRALFQDLPRWLGGGLASGAEARGTSGLLPAHPLRPADVLATFAALQWSKLLLVVDEFDRVVDEDTRTAVADTIKQCSDRGTPLSFMIIGVSDSAEELLGRHPSIQRCVTRIALPLLPRAEVERIVARGAEEAGLAFPPAARASIAELSCGLPYMAQLLALRAGQAALRAGRIEIRGGDLIAAIRAAEAEADPRIASLYDRITRGGQDAGVLGVLRAAAGAQDALGRFRVGMEGPLLRLAGLPVDPAAWQRVLASGAIRPSGGEPGLHVFTEALLPHLVLLRAVLSRQAAQPVG